MTSEMPIISGNFGMQLIDDIFTTNNAVQSEEEKQAGDIFDALFNAIDKSIEETNTEENDKNNITNPVQSNSFGPPFGMQIEGFDYFS